MSLTRLRWWVWAVEAVGVALTVAAWRTDGYLQAVALAFGTPLALVLPLALIQQGFEARLTRTVQEAASASIAAAQEVRLSGRAVAMVPEELDLWPFVAVTAPRPDGQIELRLFSPGSVDSSMQPIDVMIVVDPGPLI